jgi:hypothetical protein
MKNAVIWGVKPCGSCKNRCFGRTYRLHHHIGRNQIYNVALNSLILSALMMEVMRSSESSGLTRVRRRHISENGILQSHNRINVKSYNGLLFTKFAFLKMGKVRHT